MKVLKEWSGDFLHLFFPHNCTGCGSDVLENNHQLCLRCRAELPSTNFFENAGNPVEQIFYGSLPVRNAAAGYFFTNDYLLQHLLVQLKYRGNQQIGIYMGKLLGNELLKSTRFSEVDIIIPLPLNPK